MNRSIWEIIFEWALWIFIAVISLIAVILALLLTGALIMSPFLGMAGLMYIFKQLFM